jgi:hypothetical protein
MHHKYYPKNNLRIGHVSGINFLFKNEYLTDTFSIRVPGRIGHVSNIIFLFKNTDLTDTFPIRVSKRIRRVSISSTDRIRFVTIFWVSELFSKYLKNTCTFSFLLDLCKNLQKTLESLLENFMFYIKSFKSFEPI